jgi:hypothetical protein
MKRNGKIGLRIFNGNRTQPGSYTIRSPGLYTIRSPHAAELHSGRITFVNIHTNTAVHSSKQCKNTVCKGKFFVKIKLITANSRAKDKYVKIGMINLKSNYGKDN